MDLGSGMGGILGPGSSCKSHPCWTNLEDRLGWGWSPETKVTPCFPVSRDKETLGQKAQILQANLTSPSHTG